MGALLQLLRSEGGWEEFCKRVRQTPHPVLPLFSKDQVAGLLEGGFAEEELVEKLKARERAIELEKSEPLYYGYEPDMWRDADRILKGGKEILVLGGNRSGKSEWAAKRVVQMLEEKAGCAIWCFSTSFETSVRDQQRLVWKYLPSHWRQAKRTRTTNVSYTQKGGFTQKLFVAPNGSECRFMNYGQDAEVIEGGQIDLWWGDELIPADWIITLRSRTVDRGGKGIVTQTPIKGYTQTVAEYLNGASVKHWVDCELLPGQKLWPGGKPGMVPYTMGCLNKDHGVIFFQPSQNPYIPYDQLVSAWRDKGSLNILCRVYGVTSGMSNCKFPRFAAHNIVPHDKLPAEGTNYHVLDFSWSKPWAMLWARAVRNKDRVDLYIYREWPNYNDHGEWVLRSEKPDGSPGPAQSAMGYGIGDYRRIIRELEKGPDGAPELVFARYGDPRSGASTVLADEGATTILQMLEDGPDGLLVEPVAGKDGKFHIGEGVNLINTLLEYDVDKPLDVFNSPRLYVSDKCQNTIECLRMWTGMDGDKGASKDFVDLVRYLAMMNPDDMRVRQELYAGGSY